jgi:hypothetical protein
MTLVILDCLGEFLETWAFALADIAFVALSAWIGYGLVRFQRGLSRRT